MRVLKVNRYFCSKYPKFFAREIYFPPKFSFARDLISPIFFSRFARDFIICIIMMGEGNNKSLVYELHDSFELGLS